MTSVFEYIKQFFADFFNLMATFRVRDFLDILIVAIIIYNLIKLIRETRAIQLMKGVVVLAIAYAAADILDMQAITYLLNLVFKYGMVIIVVLFQPELRHALESIGRSSWSKFNPFSARTVVEEERRKVLTRVINQVANAASDMSYKRIGALMVFERDILLGDVIQTGTLVDADVSVRLIKNIFFPNTPLHDGAMVIRDTRIYAAGCILPLTENTGLDRNLGTRHRAALGISEVSDAVVVVVSEETGVISIAQKGVLMRDLTDGELRENLTKYLIDSQQIEAEQSPFGRLKQRLKGDKEHE